MKKHVSWIIVILLGLGWFIDRNTSSTFASDEQVINVSDDKVWEAFEIKDLIAKRKRSKRFYLPFLNRPTLKMGLYALPKGATDRQSPHNEDEVYYIENGKATLQIGKEDHKVKKGSVIFVKRGIPHKFHSIEEPLDVLVFFSSAKPAE